MKNSPPKKKKKRVELKVRINLWKIIIIILLFIFFAPFLMALAQNSLDKNKIDLSQALSDIKQNKVKKVEIQEEQLIFEYQNGDTKITTKEKSVSFPELLDRSDIEPDAVEYTVVDQTIARAVAEIAGIVLPLLLMAAFFFIILRMQTRGAQDIFSFGKSKAKLFAKGKQAVNFNDVAGADDAKKELEEVVDFLKNPAKYKRIGARTPKGALLVGPSGVGKTLLAKAVAGEAGVPFFSMAGSEFMEMLVGVGASRVRDLFAQAKAAAPAIIFIDEIDAIGRQRGRGLMGGHDEREQTLNQILVEMDGFTPNDNVIVVAATNRGDLLDPALLRPGRFDRRVVLDMPDKEGREAILKIHAIGKKFTRSVDWGHVADRTVGFSGADLENMLNEAAILAARENKKGIEMKDIDEAATKVKLGPAKKRLQSDEDRRITAYHEGGHAIAAHFLPKTDPVQRVSIVARGMSLGHTEIAPVADRSHETKTRLLQSITALLGGRAAEQEIFNEMTAGAASDIKTATKYARAMVVELGMSALGPINFGSNAEYGDFGRLTAFEESEISPATKEKIDLEVKRIIDTSYQDAAALVKKHRKILDKLATELLKKETLNRDEFEKLVGKKQEEKLS
jgi:cell division protease FtsH